MVERFFWQLSSEYKQTLRVLGNWTNDERGVSRGRRRRRHPGKTDDLRIYKNNYSQTRYESLMKLSVGRYSTLLMVQIILLLADLGINSFSVMAKRHNVVMLVLFILQDVLLIIALAVLLLTFFTTFVFQAGLVELLYDRFRLTIIMCMIYFIMTTILHIWTLSVRWKDPTCHFWSTPLLICYAFQRTIAPFYYYFYKRAALRISDPRFYEDIEWLPEK